MKRRDFFSVVAGSIAASAIRPTLIFAKRLGVEKSILSKVSKARPNIFIYIADDQYKASVGCYGASPSNTPNIDKLAEQGLRFTNCFTPSSICTPNRGVLLTGMYPLKNGAHANHSGFKDGIKSLPNYMKELGYRAAIAGKDGIQKPSDLYHWQTKIEKTEERVPGADEPKHDRHRKSDLTAIEKYLIADDPRPFCLFHAASLPHTPYLNKLPNGLEGYDASNYYMDYEFGQVLDMLKRHGLEENTLVIYVNDNEAGIPRSKFTLYETGIHVPMIISWPGRIKLGTTTDAMVSFIDIMPTLIETASDKVPEDMDGKSLLNVLEGKTNHHHDELFFSYTGVSVGSERQEIPYPIRAMRTHRYKYIRNINYTVPHPKQKNIMLPYEELYDLQNDPEERNNLTDSPEFQSLKREMSTKLDAWMQKMDDRGIESEKEVLFKYPPKDKARKSN